MKATAKKMDVRTNKLPKITVVTPSYNQAQYLEQTILSVLRQDYPRLEYLVLDGGSSDGSARIIKKYEKHISYWRSEPDSGQSSAIADGFEMASGEILCWINSDDLMLPGCLKYVGGFFADNPTELWLTGGTTVIDENNRVLYYRKAFPITFNIMATVVQGAAQPSSFWRKDLYERVNGLNRDRQFCMDLDLFLRFISIAKPARTAKQLCAFREHAQAKTSTLGHIRIQENELIRSAYNKRIPGYKKKIYWLYSVLWGKLTTSFPRKPVTIKIPELK